MGLCGSSTCGCGVTSSASTATAINGYVPTIGVTGSGVSGDPYDLTLNSNWADEVAEAANRVLAPAYLPRQVVVFTASGSFTKATYSWLKAIRVRMVGGGGGGGGAGTTGASQGAVGGGGGAGAYAERFITDIAGLAASETITIGSGGTGGSTAGGNGTDGGDTIAFGITAYGGILGRGGTAVSATFLHTLGGGASPVPTGTFDHGTRGNPGLTGTGAEQRNAGGVGGLSNLGTGGSPGNGITAVGSDGGDGEYGGGGGGGANRPSQGTGRSGGAGGDGVVILELYG